MTRPIYLGQAIHSEPAPTVLTGSIYILGPGIPHPSWGLPELLTDTLVLFDGVNWVSVVSPPIEDENMYLTPGVYMENQFAGNNNYFTGTIDNVEFHHGARYTANFIPPRIRKTAYPFYLYPYYLIFAIDTQEFISFNVIDQIMNPADILNKTDYLESYHTLAAYSKTDDYNIEDTIKNTQFVDDIMYPMYILRDNEWYTYHPETLFTRVS